MGPPQAPWCVHQRTADSAFGLRGLQNEFMFRDVGMTSKKAFGFCGFVEYYMYRVVVGSSLI